MFDEFAILVASVADVAAADAALHRLLSCGPTEGVHVDAVTLGRTRCGDVRFDLETAPVLAWPPVSLAAGLASSVYPSVGADRPSSKVDERAVLHAVAGRVATAVGRTGLRELGEYLDRGRAGVVAVVPAGSAERLLRCLAEEADGIGTMVLSMRIDVADLERAALAVVPPPPRF